MKYFHLPDLGEGLPEATILKWHVELGDDVTLDQPLVTVETAKAAIDIPSPFQGKILKLFGDVNGVITTGSPLLGFEGQGYISEPVEKQAIVGTIEKERGVFNIAAAAPSQNVQATPAAYALARKLKIDIKNIPSKGRWLTPEDIHEYYNTKKQGAQPLTSVRLAMARSLMKSATEIVPSTCMEEIDIHHWPSEVDVTLHVIRSMASACDKVPLINAHFDFASLHYTLNQNVHVGMAVGSEQGLFMPVLRDVNHRDLSDLRKEINTFKEKAKQKSFTKEDMEGATILFSNFGTLGTRYATPVIIPPAVTIVGIGKIFEKVVMHENRLEVHPMLPIVLTINHLLLTGAEASQFMKFMLEELTNDSCRSH